MAEQLEQGWKSGLRVITEPELYQMVVRIYFPILFPLTFLIVLLALALDRALGWTQLLPSPLNLWAAAFSFLMGTGIWLWSYRDLVYGGEGSPSPAIKRTQKLVTWGIYAYCRNPSIHGKLLGVLAVGLLISSPSFCLVLVPLLLAGSLIEKVWRQEPVLVELFGDEYLAYRQRVPLFLPRLWVPAAERRGPRA
ncbi:MAG: methyltransferase family protein [Myxococcota bacterium]